MDELWTMIFHHRNSISTIHRLRATDCECSKNELFRANNDASYIRDMFMFYVMVVRFFSIKSNDTSYRTRQRNHRSNFGNSKMIWRRCSRQCHTYAVSFISVILFDLIINSCFSPPNISKSFSFTQ